MAQRHLTHLDNIIDGFDKMLRTLTPGTQVQTRDVPRPQDPTIEDKLSDEEKRHAAGLMRVNHTGEVCAQALYQGQALTAKLPEVREEMEHAADEEIDHLAWCEHRLNELGSHTSRLNPLWYTLSFGIGAGAGLIGDKISLGFVAATEEQVCKHLESHLDQLPHSDSKSKVIVEQMLIDEAAHAASAINAGGAIFPKPLKSMMTVVSKAMTKTSYRI